MHNGERETSYAEILLRSRKDAGKMLHIDRSTEQIGRHVCDQRLPESCQRLVVSKRAFNTIHRLVVTKVQESTILLREKDIKLSRCSMVDEDKKKNGWTDSAKEEGWGKRFL